MTRHKKDCKYPSLSLNLNSSSYLFFSPYRHLSLSLSLIPLIPNPPSRNCRPQRPSDVTARDRLLLCYYSFFSYSATPGVQRHLVSDMEGQITPPRLALRTGKMAGNSNQPSPRHGRRLSHFSIHRGNSLRFCSATANRPSLPATTLCPWRSVTASCSSVLLGGEAEGGCDGKLAARLCSTPVLRTLHSLY